MNLEAFVYKLQKLLRDEVERNVQVLASGGVDNMENYKYITGKIHALDAVSQEISNLLEEKEQKNNVRSITKEV
jgi:deoxyribose-phosphate aldolase|tara:strand:- start:189 stop:410 length:222 start_codon:yes stop_codon:yes gene_type:complete